MESKVQVNEDYRRLAKKDKIIRAVAKEHDIAPEVVKAIETAIFELAKETLEQGRLSDPENYKEVRIPFFGRFGIVPKNLKRLTKLYQQKHEQGESKTSELKGRSPGEQGESQQNQD